MDKINIWNKLSIHKHKVISVLFIFCFITVSFGQNKKSQLDNQFEVNLPHYDERILHYGFSLGINTTRFKLTHSPTYTNVDTFTSVVATRSPGFSLGFIVNLRLDEFWDLRLTPTVAFYERTVNFQRLNQPSSSQINDATYIEFPLLLKYKSQRRRNMRMYMVGGIKPGIEAGSKKKEKTDDMLRTANKDFSIDYGFGFDIYYPLFKFSPELRISHGFNNLLNKDQNSYAQSIKRLTSHTVTLFFHFQ